MNQPTSTTGNANTGHELNQLAEDAHALLAATALVHDLTVVSRDEDGFRRTGVRMINPFSKPKPTGN